MAIISRRFEVKDAISRIPNGPYGMGRMGPYGMAQNLLSANASPKNVLNTSRRSLLQGPCIPL